MILPGDTVDTLHRNTLNGYQRTFQSCKKLLGKITLNIFLHEDLIYLFSSLKGFYHGTNAENHFTFIYHCILLFFLFYFSRLKYYTTIVNLYFTTVKYYISQTMPNSALALFSAASVRVAPLSI